MWKWPSIKKFRHWENHPAALSFASSKSGKFALLLVFSLMYLNVSVLYSPIVVVALFLTSFFPKQRRNIIIVASLLLIFIQHWGLTTVLNINLSNKGYYIGWVLFYLFAFIIMELRFRFRDHLLSRYSLSFLILLLLILLILVYFKILTNLYMFGFLVFFNRFFWFLAYSLKSNKRKLTDRLHQVLLFMPMWGSTLTPFPKGINYLDQIEIKDPENLARVQLKAIKLMFWALILGVILNEVMRITLIFHIPSLQQSLINLEIHHQVLLCHEAWLVLFSHFIITSLKLFFIGHAIIAIVRMSGFNALRNTYKPFYSLTLVEFWNRYYYYFKELLVDHFFYPCFFRFFKGEGQAKIRLFVATMAAAGLGNAIYHFFAKGSQIFTLGLIHACQAYFTYVIYCLILGMGIGISQIRSQRCNINELNLLIKSRKCFFVLGFYLLLSVINSPYLQASGATIFHFYGRLIGIS